FFKNKCMKSAYLLAMMASLCLQMKLRAHAIFLSLFPAEFYSFIRIHHAGPTEGIMHIPHTSIKATSMDKNDTNYSTYFQWFSLKDRFYTLNDNHLRSLIR